MARLIVACWVATAASTLFAQSVPLSEYSTSRVRPTSEVEQRSLAQQYLASPPGVASASDQTSPREAAQPPNDRTTPTYPNGSSSATVPGPDLRSAYETPSRSDREDTSTGFQTDPAGRLLARPELTGTRPNVPAAAFNANAPEPPELLPAPEVPPRQACAEAATFGTSDRVPDGLPGFVSPATHLEDDASDTARPPATEIRAAPDGKTASASPAPSPAALPLEKAREALPLKPPGKAGTESHGRPTGGLPSLVTMIGGLAVVLGIFFLVVWGMRRATPGAPMTLPNQVVEVLGRAPLAGRHQVHLLRCGHKLLLVSVTPDTAETLAEITDPFEVDRIAGLCEQARPNSSSATFRRVFQQFSHEGKGEYAS